MVWLAHPVIWAELGVQFQVNVVPGTEAVSVTFNAVPLHTESPGGLLVTMGVGFTHMVYVESIPVQLVVAGVI
jgi:hypothetical protein